MVSWDVKIAKLAKAIACKPWKGLPGAKSDINCMKRIIFLLNILLLTTSGIYSQTSAQAGIANLKLKIGPLQYSNESRIDIVYGITTENAEQDFITALYFNFGGQFACENKSVSAIFDFGSSSGLMIAEPENFVASMMSKIVSREQKGFEIKYDFRNPIPPISLFAQEKINLRPNGKRNKVLLTMKTQCEEQLALPLTLAKFNVSGIE